MVCISEDGFLPDFSAFCCPAVACSARGFAAEQAACGCPGPSKGNVVKAYALTVNEQMIVPRKKRALFHIISPNLTLTPKEICWVETIQKKKNVVFNIKEGAMVSSGNTAKPARQSWTEPETHTRDHSPFSLRPPSPSNVASPGLFRSARARRRVY